MTITVKELLKRCPMRNTMHGHGDGFFMYEYQSVEHPRLRRLDKYYKKDKSIVSTFFVDGDQCESLAQAVERLNVPVQITDEEKELLSRFPHDDWLDRTALKELNITWLDSRNLGQKALVEWKAGKCRRLVKP